MGLDMYLFGEIYFYKLTDEQLKTQPVEQVFRLARWWDQEDLHCYIVETFFNCEEPSDGIYLNAENLSQIVDVIREGKLPKTDEMFDDSDPEDESGKAEDIATFEAAIQWLAVETDDTERSVVYRGYE